MQVKIFGPFACVRSMHFQVALDTTQILSVWNARESVPEGNSICTLPYYVQKQLDHSHTSHTL